MAFRIYTVMTRSRYTSGLAMLRLYRLTTGEAAATFGEKFVQNDFNSALLRLRSVVEAKYGELPAEVRTAVEAFCLGVNSYIAEHKNSLPDWVEAITPVDVVCRERESVEPIVSRTLEPVASQIRNAIRQETRSAGMSNMWIIGPERSAENCVLFLSDPHTPWTGGNQWYDAHLNAGDLNVMGAVRFGSPFVTIGHTDKVTWGITYNSVDASDIYMEKLNPENPMQYEYDGEWRDMTVETAYIKVKTGDGKLETRQRKLEYTHHGPVIYRKGDRAFAVRIAQWESMAMIEQAYRFNKAKSLDDMKAAIALRGLYNLNIMVGDTEGNIFYIYNATVNQKDEKINWGKPVPGWTSETEWGDLFPLDKLPTLTNPPTHFMQNCNTAPWFVTPDPLIPVAGVPGYIAAGVAPGPRGQRALDLLSAKDNVTVEDMMRMSMDVYMLVADLSKPVLLDAYEDLADEFADADGSLRQAVELLREWDNEALRDSIGSTIFHLWWNRIRVECVPGS